MFFGLFIVAVVYSSEIKQFTENTTVHFESARERIVSGVGDLKSAWSNFKENAKIITKEITYSLPEEVYNSETFAIFAKKKLENLLENIAKTHAEYRDSELKCPNE